MLRGSGSVPQHADPRRTQVVNTAGEPTCSPGLSGAPRVARARAIGSSEYRSPTDRYFSRKMTVGDVRPLSNWIHTARHVPAYVLGILQLNCQLPNPW